MARRGFRPRFPGRGSRPGKRREPVEKRRRPERPADRLRGAQPLDQPRPDRIYRVIARRRQQAFLVHHDRVKARFKEMAGHAVHARSRRRNSADHALPSARPGPSGSRASGRDARVVGRQAIAPHRDTATRSGLAKEVAVEFVIRAGEEHPLAPVAALGDVMRKIWNDKPAEALEK